VSVCRLHVVCKLLKAGGSVQLEVDFSFITFVKGAFIVRQEASDDFLGEERLELFVSFLVTVREAAIAAFELLATSSFFCFLRDLG